MDSYPPQAALGQVLYPSALKQINDRILAEYPEISLSYLSEFVQQLPPKQREALVKHWNNPELEIMELAYELHTSYIDAAQNLHAGQLAVAEWLHKKPLSDSEKTEALSELFPMPQKEGDDQLSQFTANDLNAFINQLPEKQRHALMKSWAGAEPMEIALDAKTSFDDALGNLHQGRLAVAEWLENHSIAAKDRDWVKKLFIEHPTIGFLPSRPANSPVPAGELAHPSAEDIAVQYLTARYSFLTPEQALDALSGLSQQELKMLNAFYEGKGGTGGGDTSSLFWEGLGIPLHETSPRLKNLRKRVLKKVRQNGHVRDANAWLDENYFTRYEGLTPEDLWATADEITGVAGNVLTDYLKGDSLSVIANRYDLKREDASSLVQSGRYALARKLSARWDQDLEQVPDYWLEYTFLGATAAQIEAQLQHLNQKQRTTFEEYRRGKNIERIAAIHGWSVKEARRNLRQAVGAIDAALAINPSARSAYYRDMRRMYFYRSEEEYKAAEESLAKRRPEAYRVYQLRKAGKTKDEVTKLLRITEKQYARANYSIGDWFANVLPSDYVNDPTHWIHENFLSKVEGTTEDNFWEAVNFLSLRDFRLVHDILRGYSENEIARAYGIQNERALSQRITEIKERLLQKLKDPKSMRPNERPPAPRAPASLAVLKARDQEYEYLITNLMERYPHINREQAEKTIHENLPDKDLLLFLELSAGTIPEEEILIRYPKPGKLSLIPGKVLHKLNKALDDGQLAASNPSLNLKYLSRFPNLKTVDLWKIVDETPGPDRKLLNAFMLGGPSRSLNEQGTRLPLLDKTLEPILADFEVRLKALGKHSSLTAQPNSLTIKTNDEPTTVSGPALSKLLSKLKEKYLSLDNDQIETILRSEITDHELGFLADYPDTVPMELNKRYRVVINRQKTLFDALNTKIEQALGHAQNISNAIKATYLSKWPGTTEKMFWEVANRLPPEDFEILQKHLEGNSQVDSNRIPDIQKKLRSDLKKLVSENASQTAIQPLEQPDPLSFVRKDGALNVWISENYPSLNPDQPEPNLHGDITARELGFLVDYRAVGPEELKRKYGVPLYWQQKVFEALNAKIEQELSHFQNISNVIKKTYLEKFPGTTEKMFWDSANQLPLEDFKIMQKYLEGDSQIDPMWIQGIQKKIQGDLKKLAADSRIQPKNGPLNQIHPQPYSRGAGALSVWVDENYPSLDAEQTQPNLHGDITYRELGFLTDYRGIGPEELKRKYGVPVNRQLSVFKTLNAKIEKELKHVQNSSDFIEKNYLSKVAGSTRQMFWEVANQLPMEDFEILQKHFDGDAKVDSTRLQVIQEKLLVNLKSLDARLRSETVIDRLNRRHPHRYAERNQSLNDWVLELLQRFPKSNRNAIESAIHGRLSDREIYLILDYQSGISVKDLEANYRIPFRRAGEVVNRLTQNVLDDLESKRATDPNEWLKEHYFEKHPQVTPAQFWGLVDEMPGPSGRILNAYLLGSPRRKIAEDFNLKIDAVDQIISFAEQIFEDRLAGKVKKYPSSLETRWLTVKYPKFPPNKIADCIEHLPTLQRTAVDLLVKGKTVNEIADLMEEPATTVRWLLLEGKAGMAQQLGVSPENN